MSPIHKKIFVAISTINQLQKLAKINNVAFENPVLPGNEIYKSLLLGNKAIEFHQILLQFVVCLEYSLRRQKVFFPIFCCRISVYLFIVITWSCLIHFVIESINVRVIRIFGSIRVTKFIIAVSQTQFVKCVHSW